MKNQQRAVKVQTSKVIGPNGEVIPATLDDLVKQIKKAILHKEYVPGSKTYNANYPIVRGYLQSACLCTIELINRGAEKEVLIQINILYLLLLPNHLVQRTLILMKF